MGRMDYENIEKGLPVKQGLKRVSIKPEIRQVSIENERLMDDKDSFDSFSQFHIAFDEEEVFLV